MKTFKKKNEFGIEYEYYIVSETENEGKKYIVFTDFVNDDNNELRLFAAEQKDNQVVPISDEESKKLVEEFKNEMNKMIDTMKNLRKASNDLSFTSVNEDGIEMINDIVKIVPNKDNKEEPYIIFTDYRLDDNDEFINQYGKIVGTEGAYKLNLNITPQEKAYVDSMLDDEIVKYVNDAIEESMYE